MDLLINDLPVLVILGVLLFGFKQATAREQRTP